MFIVDLDKLLRRLITEGHEIILATDANEEWDTDGSRIFELATRNGMYDLAKERHGGPVPPTYRRSNCARRIDYVLGSEGVLNNMRAFGIANELYDPVLGDHRPQYLDVDIAPLLQLNKYDFGAPSARKLKSSNPKNVEAYIKKVLENFSMHNVFNRIESLWDELAGKAKLNKSQMSKYEAIDRDVTRLCRNAENVLQTIRKEKYVWSPALDSAGKFLHYWQMRLKHINNKERTKDLLEWGNTLCVYDECSDNV